MGDDTADELLVDLAADEAQHFAPRLVAAVGVEQGHQLVLAQRALVGEAADGVGRGEELQEGAVHEAVEAGAAQAEDVVARVQRLDHRARRVRRLAGRLLALRHEPRPEGLLQVLPVEEVAGQAAGPALHAHGHAPQQTLLVLHVQLLDALQAKVAVGVPLVAEELHRLLVEGGALAGQLLLAGQEGHHRQQHRVAGQKADGPGAADAFQHAGNALAGGVRVAREGEREPAADESLDLLLIQVLDPEVPEAGAAQDRVAVAHRPRGGDDAGARVAAGEPGDLLHHPLALALLEDLVQAVEHHQRGHLLQAIVQPAGLQAPLLRAPHEVEVLQEGVALAAPAEGVEVAHLDQERQRALERRRPGERLPGRVAGRLQHAEEQVAHQRGFARPRFPREDQQPVTGRRDHVQHALRRLAHVAGAQSLHVGAQAVAVALVQAGRIGVVGTLAAQARQQVLGDLHRGRVLPHRLAHEDVADHQAAGVIGVGGSEVRQVHGGVPPAHLLGVEVRARLVRHAGLLLQQLADALHVARVEGIAQRRGEEGALPGPAPERRRHQVPDALLRQRPAAQRDPPVGQRRRRGQGVVVRILHALEQLGGNLLVFDKRLQRLAVLPQVPIAAPPRLEVGDEQVHARRVGLLQRLRARGLELVLAPRLLQALVERGQVVLQVVAAGIGNQVLKLPHQQGGHG